MAAQVLAQAEGTHTADLPVICLTSRRSKKRASNAPGRRRPLLDRLDAAADENSAGSMIRLTMETMLHTGSSDDKEEMKTILIVEDVDLNIDLLTQLLEDEYSLLIAKDGAAGVAMAEENGPTW